MGEVVYSLNGKYFKDFGIFISKSTGLADELKPKKRQSFDWPEYNGLAINPNEKLKYEAREITLSGWVVGNSWDEMKANFQVITKEFRKAGKQRLIIEPFGNIPLIFDVNTEVDIPLVKSFSDGRMVGTFDLKLMEYNPIKKIFRLSQNNLQLSFSTSKWVELNIDGAIESYVGDVNINKSLTERVLTKYGFNGRNYLHNSTFSRGFDNWSVNSGNQTADAVNKQALLRLNAQIQGIFQGCPGSGTYTLSFETKAFFQDKTSALIGFNSNPQSFNIPGSVSIWTKSTIVINSATASDALIFYGKEAGRNEFYIRNIKLEKGNKATDWTPAPEDVHFISIAGNVDEITGLTTNADSL